MGKIKNFLLFAVLCCISSWATAQTITGEVVNRSSQQPVIGATISAGEAGTSTDEMGRFSITLPNGVSSLSISSIGFIKQTIRISNQSSIRIQLEEDENSLDNVVVVGYGTQKKANLTGAVSTVPVSKVMESRPVTDVGRALQGAVPGLSITTTTGDLATNPTIRLRGLTGSTNAGNGAQPLILVDNVEFPNLQLLNPDDVESISVLKDAASASIYGSRATWGVILITTKSGKKNSRSTVNYNNNFSWSTPTNQPRNADAAEGPTYTLSAAQRTNPNQDFFGSIGMTFTSESIEKIREWQRTYGGQDLGREMVEGRDFEIIGGRAYYYRPWDPAKEYMRKWAPQQNHNLNFSGGNEKTSFNVSLGYMGQEGVLKVKTDQFTRYNATIGVNSSVTPWLDINGKIILTKSEFETPFSYSGATFDPLYYMYRWHGVYPYGTYQGKGFRNIITEMEQANMTKNSINFARAQLGGLIKITKGLTFNANYTYTSNNNHYYEPGGQVFAWNQWNPIWDYIQVSPVSANRVSYSSGWNEQHTVRSFGTYEKKFTDHNFKFIGGMDVDLYKGWSQYSERRDLIDQNLPELDLATGDQYIGGGRGHWSTQGFFGRINYDYKGKYLLELNARYDGSSFFPAQDQWNLFKSASAGYVISEENFMEFTRDYLDHLKIRASYGSVGSTDVGGATFRPSMSSSASGWWIGGSNLLTVNTPNLVPNTLTWETINTLDFGLDARFLNGKIGLTFDWYRRTTKDMITPGIVLPSTFGAAPPRRNYGELQTTGWEIAVDLNHSFRNGLNLNGTLMLSDFQEEITKYDGNLVNGLYAGKKLGEIWGYKTDRFFTKDDFEQDASGELVRDAQGHYIPVKEIPSQSRHESGWFFYGPGDIKYKDLNGDGEIWRGSSSLDDKGDLTVIGNSTPRYQYGIRLGAEFKGFDFNMFIQGVGKREMWGNGMIAIPGFNPFDNMYAHQMDYWTEDNPNAFYPRPTNTGQSNNTQNFLIQDKYLMNMAYTRLKNISLGYTIPVNITKRLRFSRLRFYVNGENLWTRDKLHVPIDPEVGFRTPSSPAATFGRVYPYRKAISFGLQATL